MSEDVIEAERTGDVALIRLNRPAARNALNVTLAQAICDEVAAAQDAAAIVITGADPAFCAGLDLRDLGTDDMGAIPHFTGVVAASAVPTIAAVNGAAVTGGFELALGCDFIVASERAVFADTHLRVGVYPGPVLVDLPRRVGMAWARQMSLTGNFVDAATALRIGLVNEVVAHDDLVPYVLGLAAAIAEQNRAMVAAMREDWDDTFNREITAAHTAHIATISRTGLSATTSATLVEHREAVLDRSRDQRKD